MANDPNELIREFIEGGRSVRLGKGVIAKTTQVYLGLIVLWCIALWRLNDNMLLNSLILAACFIVTLLGIWFIRSSRKFAEHNPAQAMLEGAEFLEYKRMEIAAKGVSTTSERQIGIEHKPNA